VQKNRLKKLADQADLSSGLLEHEMNLIIKWEAAAENVQNVIDDFTFDQLQAVMAFQNIFKNSVAKLKGAAQTFKAFASGNPLVR